MEFCVPILLYWSLISDIFSISPKFIGGESFSLYSPIVLRKQAYTKYQHVMTLLRRISADLSFTNNAFWNPVSVSNIWRTVFLALYMRFIAIYLLKFMFFWHAGSKTDVYLIMSTVSNVLINLVFVFVSCGRFFFLVGFIVF